MTLEIDKGSGIAILRDFTDQDMVINKASALAVLRNLVDEDIIISKASVIVVLTPDPVPRIVSNQPPPVGATD